MAKVFISYSRKDIEFAKRLTTELQNSDLDFWIDWEGIPPTVDWWREIEKGIEEADIFLFLISPDSSVSKVCGQEIDTAVNNAKRIIPLVVRDISSDEAPQQLSHLNWIFFRDSDDFDIAFQKLLTGIHTDFEWAQQHRWLQVRALDWERDNKDSSSLLRGRDLEEAEFQLATNTSKEPHPTDLQRDYVFTSQKAADRQRKMTLSISIAGIIGLAILAVVAIVMAIRATTQSKIALARQLTAQAQLLHAEDDSKQMIASLLSIQSLKLYPTEDAINFLLQYNSAARPIANISSSNVKKFEFSPDGQSILWFGCVELDCNLHLWDIKASKDIFPVINIQAIVSEIGFSSNSKHIFVLLCDKIEEISCIDGYVNIYETNTGRKIDSIFIGENAIVKFSQDRKYFVSYSCHQSFVGRVCLSDSNLRTIELATKKEKIYQLSKSNKQIIIAAISPDLKYVVLDMGYPPITGSDSKNIFTQVVREIATGRDIFTISNSDTPYNIIDFSQDGRYISLMDYFEKRIHVWDIIEKKEILTDNNFLLSGEFYTHALFSPDNNFVVGIGLNANTRIWEIATGRDIARIVYPSDLVQFSSDGEHFVSSNRNNVAVVRETASGREIARMTHDGNVTSVAFSPDGQYVASSGGNTIRLWDFPTSILPVARYENIWTSSNYEYLFLARCERFNESNKCIKRKAHLWEIATKQQIANTSLEGDELYLSPDSRYVILYSCENELQTGSCNRSQVTVMDIIRDKEVFNKTFTSYVSDLQFNSNGKFFIGRTRDNIVYVWETATGWETAKVSVIEIENLIDFLGIRLSSDGNYLIARGDTFAIVWEVKTGKKIAHLTNDDDENITVSPNDQYIATVELNTVRIWDVKKKKEVLQLPPMEYETTFSPNGEYVATIGDHDDTLYVREIATGREAVYHAPDSVVYIESFSPDSKLLSFISSSDNSSHQTIHIWDIASEKEVAILRYNDPIYSVAISPDNKYILVVSKNINASGKANVWDISNKKEVASVNHSDSTVEWAFFTADSKNVVSYGHDKTIRFWNWEPEDVIENACSLMPRNLKYVEWEQYIRDALPYPTKQKDGTCPKLPIESKPTTTS